MLQYSLMHLTGYPSVTHDDLKNFRQWDSMTPGHPENFVTDGIEVTTGPLGQGICNAVGLALAEAHLAARFNKPGCEVVDHYTYCIMGDGCNMEGVSGEAASLAGHWGLGKLIVFYDNKISIDGHTDISFTEDVSARYAAYGWHTQHVEDGNTDLEGIRKAIEEAKKVTDKPSLIKVSTIIGYGSPNKADSHDVHGAALGPDEVAATRANLNWNYSEFEVPEEVSGQMDKSEKGAALEAEWEATLAKYEKEFPEDAKGFKQLISRELPAGWEKCLPTYTSEDKGIATRLHSQTMLNALCEVLPGFIGGSGAVEHDAHEGARRLPEGLAGGAQPAIRSSRARHGCHLQRHCAAQQRTHPVLRHLLHLHGLHARRHACGRAQRGWRDPRHDARLHRTWRGWPDAPAYRAPRVVPLHAQHARVPPVRRKRDGGSLQGGRRAPQHAVNARALAPGHAQHGHHLDRGCREGRVRCVRRRRRRVVRRHPHRNWL